MHTDPSKYLPLPLAALAAGAFLLLPILGSSAPDVPSATVAGGALAKGVSASSGAPVRTLQRMREAPGSTATSGVLDPEPMLAEDFAIAPRRSHPAADALYETRNAPQALHVGFTAQGIRVVAGAPSAELAMRLAGVGYGQRLMAVSDASLYARGNRIDYHRRTAGGAAFTEWYVNAADGLEQSFTFPTPVDDRRAGERLVVELRCAGDFTAEHAGDAIAFATAERDTELLYDGLYAFDARGRALPSRMELDGDRLSLVVDDSEAIYPVTVDPKAKGGNTAADVEFRDAGTDGIRSDRDDGDTAPADYRNGADKVKVSYTVVIDMVSKGIKTPRRVQFDLGTNRLLPRSSTQQYVGSHGELPPGVGTNGILSNTDVRIANLRGHSYLPDPTSPTGWVVGGTFAPAAMPISGVSYIALNVNLVRNHKSEIIWRLLFGPGNVGPVRALDAQPVKLTRTSETTWTVEALDLGKGVRAALAKRVGTTASHTYETVDHYSLPFRMTFTAQ